MASLKSTKKWHSVSFINRKCREIQQNSVNSFKYNTECTFKHLVCVCVCVRACMRACVDGMNLKYALHWHIHISVHSVLWQCYIQTYAHKHPQTIQG